jgi:hypothetical protein
MAKFPRSPGLKALRQLELRTSTLAAGTRLTRIYYTAGRYLFAWNLLRDIGSLNAGRNHPGAKDDDATAEQRRGICYAATDAKICLAEFFQATRCIDRAYQAPWLVVFDTAAPLRVLDLNSDFVARTGVSMAMDSGARALVREWAWDLYEAYPEIQAIRYTSSMSGGAPALAISERTLANNVFPLYPALHRGLGDDLMLDPLKNAARELGYVLR